MLKLKEAQGLMRRFEMDRGWDGFAPSLLLLHLMEELSEIGEHILVRDGYKVEGLGHDVERGAEVGREFAQAFSLLLQLANRFKVDLEEAFLREVSIMERRFGKEKWSYYMRMRGERRRQPLRSGV